ncbi:MAG: TonB family protein [Limisphaerales bacterium]|jgi:TonB family protein
METILLHILQSSLLMGAGFILYRYLLRDTGLFALNRIILLAFILSAPFVPLIQLNIQAPQTASIILDNFFVGSATEATAVQPLYSFSSLAIMLYAAGVIFFLGMLTRDLLRIRAIIKASKKTALYGHEILVNENYPTFSFFSKMVVNEKHFQDNFWEQQKVLAHELAHMRQYHTVDVLLAELAKVIFWFNPFCWKFKNAVQENCEFLADQSAIKDEDKQPKPYARLILTQSIAALGIDAMGVATVSNPFNQSQLQRRITMLTRTAQTNTSKSLFRYILAFLMTGSIVLIMSCGVEPSTAAVIQEADPNAKTFDDFSELDEVAEFKGGTSEMYKYLGNRIKYPTSAKKEGIEGKTLVKFVVDTDGAIINARVIKGFNEACDSEALRVIQAMPAWTPSTKDGKTVKTELTLPIAFRLPAE